MGGPALISDIDEAGATVKFQSQTYKVARFYARKKREETEVERAELDPLHVRFRRIGADLGSQSRQVDVGEDMEVGSEDGNHTPRTGTPESNSGPRPDMILVPDSPSLSAHLPSPRAPSERHYRPGSSFDKA